jgi:hypothetical protein
MEPVNSTVIVKLQGSGLRILPGASVLIMISFGLSMETLELDADIIDVEVRYCHIPRPVCLRQAGRAAACNLSARQVVRECIHIPGCLLALTLELLPARPLRFGT